MVLSFIPFVDDGSHNNANQQPQTDLFSDQRNQQSDAESDDQCKDGRPHFFSHLTH